MADLRISDLPELLATQLSAGDPIAIVDLSASTTKKITAENLIKDSIELLPDASIPAEKIDGGTVPDGAVTTIKLADKSVTAAKLADNSSTVVAAALPATGDFIGQHAFVTGGTNNILYTWDGTSWLLEGLITSISGDDTGLVNVYVVDNGDQTLDIRADLDDTTGPGQFLAGPSGAGGPVEQRRIVSPDLPTAGVEKGAVVVNGNGLTMDGEAIAIDNTVAQNTGAGHIVQYDDYGLVTGGKTITSADIPAASDAEKGGVRPGTGLFVTADGTLNHINNVVAGTATKITYDTEGHVTQGDVLNANDIPNLSADKIVSGTFGSNQIADDSITDEKLADYATVLMQEANPGAGAYLGQLWFTPSTAQLRIYSRGSGPQNLWLPVGFGNLQANNLRWLGTYDADLNVIVAVTAIGTSEGIVAGEPFPVATDNLSGGYFLCQVGGNNMIQPDLNNISHSPGDWGLCLGETEGWIHIDNTAGGGGSASYLNDLLDVTLDGPDGPFATAPAMALEGQQLLKYDAGDSMWKNTDRLDGGTF